MDDEAIIRSMADRIVKQFHPERIILFGSRARGDHTADSDVDLLVIVPRVENRRELRVAIRRAVNGMGLPKDIIVLTSAEYEEERDVPGTIAYPAATEGRLLYAA